MAEPINATGSPNRAQRRRLETRDKLIQAGRQVFADKGVDAATIQDITETADVGRGSFYNFFDTKEQLVEVIVAELVDGMVQLEAAVAREFDDPTAALAISVRAAIRMISANDALAWFIVRTQRVGGPLFEKFHDLTYALIERGRMEGRVKIGNPELGVILLAGGIFAALEMMLLGRLPRDSGDEIVEHLLGGLGISPAACRKLATMPLPALEEMVGGQV